MVNSSEVTSTDRYTELCSSTEETNTNNFREKGHNKLVHAIFHCGQDTEKWALKATADNCQLFEDRTPEQWLIAKVKQILHSSTNKVLQDRHAFHLDSDSNKTVYHLKFPRDYTRFCQHVLNLLFVLLPTL